MAVNGHDLTLTGIEWSHWKQSPCCDDLPGPYHQGIVERPCPCSLRTTKIQHTSFWYQKEIAVKQRCNRSFSTHIFGPKAIDSSCVQDLQNLYFHLFKLKTEGGSQCVALNLAINMKSDPLWKAEAFKDKRPPVHLESKNNVRKFMVLIGMDRNRSKLLPQIM